jgi:4'-phosphopantetheinyl transferase
MYMQIYLLEQAEADVPESNDWLGGRERDHVRSLTFLKRRADWRLGRWAAKCAIASLQNIPLHADLLATIEICPAPSGAPRVFLQELPGEVTISLSHRSGVAICALARNSVRLGCDLEIIEPHSPGFVADYFTPDEQELIEKVASADRWRVVALLWSAKESALKALQEGLRRDTRSVFVRPGQLCFGEGWNSLQVHSIEGECFYVKWREANGLVQTVVADHAFAGPIVLKAPVCGRNPECSIDAA